jgi:uncharacterized membrane protein
LLWVWLLHKPRHANGARRAYVRFAVRVCVLTLLILALAQPQIETPTRQVAVVFVVDASESMGADARTQARDLIAQAIAGKNANDVWGVVVAGARGVVEQSLSLRADVPALQSRIDGTQTNLADALTKALALLPADGTRRLVLISDGHETLGNATSVAQRAQALGVELHILPITPARLPDARVRALSLPPRLREGQPFELVLELESDQPTSGRVALFANGQYLGETPVRLSAGISRYVLPQAGAGAGFLTYSAQFFPDGDDGYPQNNRLSAVAQVEGQARILLIADDPRETDALLPALQAGGLDIALTTSANAPADALALAAYQAVIVANVPASAFSARQMERLQSYVREAGGGLLFIGGDSSFGAGGYADTPLEAALPVTMTLRDDQRLPQLTIGYLIDTSGSMQNSDDGVFTYLQLAQQALLRSLNTLQATDRVGIANFDSAGTWIARFQTIDDQRALASAVAGLQAGGGTDILAGLRLMEADISAEEAPLKHVVLLTDGGASSAGLVETAQRMYETAGVTLSVVALGTYQPPFLSQMAQVAQGNYHVVRDASQIPRIFAQEAAFASRSYVIDAPFTPALGAFSPIMDGITALPALGGYVATTLKPEAQAVLVGDAPYRDPVLAVWQYGLGRAVAFTSDASARWGRDWLAWRDYARFWGQALSWVVLESADARLQARVEGEGASARLIVEAQGDAGEALNGLAMVASVLAADNSAQALTLTQTAAGEYSAPFLATQEGAYLLSISAQGADGDALRARTAWVQGYSAEYDGTPPNLDLLLRLTALADGRDLRDDPTQAFVPPLVPRVARTPLWELLLWLALGLWLLDIALRKLRFTRDDLARLRARLTPPPAPPPADDPRTRLDALKQAKARARK